jgi:hypothetical protein
MLLALRVRFRSVLFAKAGERGAHEACAEKVVGVGAWCAPRVICFLTGEDSVAFLQNHEGPCVYGRRADKASITEASSIRTGANSSPSRIASGPVPATLGISRILGA